MDAAHMEESEFKLDETLEFLDHEIVRNMILGRGAGYVSRGAVCAEDSNRIAASFLSIATRDRKDGVPARYVGAYHYGKTTAEYFEDIEREATNLHQLFVAVDNPIRRVIQEIEAALMPLGLTLRAARYRGRQASQCVARWWTDDGSFSLRPHEDIAQLLSPLQEDFEIQKAAAFSVVGVNVCVKKSCEGANPVIWNLIPSQQMRVTHQTVATGYPYPEALVADVPRLDVKISEGDIYLLNSKCIHAVTRATSPGERITLSFLMGQINENTVVYWT